MTDSKTNESMALMRAEAGAGAKRMAALLPDDIASFTAAPEAVTRV